MFMTNCNNKGCGKFQEPYLDPKSNQVFCSLCNKEIQNISNFTKNQMKASKQFKKKQSTSFALTCKFCNLEARPILQKDDLICSNCKKLFSNVSPIFKNMLKDQLTKIDKDD